MAYAALIALSVNLFTVLQASAGPTFNATGGMQFWLVAAIVFRAADRWRAQHQPAFRRGLVSAGGGRRRIASPNFMRGHDL